MIDDDRSIHLVHGPGNDCMLLCLQVAKRALISGSSVLWLGDLPAAPLKSTLGSLGEEALSRLLVGSVEGIATGSRVLKTADLVILWPWCKNHGRASKSEVSLLREIMESAEGRVVATSLGNEDASGGLDMTARSRAQLEKMGLDTWFLTRQNMGSRRILKSSNREIALKRHNGEFSVV